MSPAHRPKHPHISEAVERNIRTLVEIRRLLESRRTRQERLADSVTSFSGSIPFVYSHIIFFAAWVAVNLNLIPGLKPFDPFPFGFLTMLVSLEAIFLSTFVLISQNRQAQVSDRRADLDLQINLLAEYEITKLLQLTDAVADHLKLEPGKDLELEELKEQVLPHYVLREMEKQKNRLSERV